MKCIITSLLLLTAGMSVAQVLTIKNIQSPDTVYVLTIVESAQRPEVAKKINSVIYKDWGYDPAAKNPFEGMSQEDGFYNETGANNDRVLSMIVEQSHAGCGLHVTRYIYNFDSRTGAPVDQKKLFGAEGEVKLKKALYKPWKAALKTAAAGKHPVYEDQYKACLANAETMTEQDPREMLIADQGIRFWAEGCLEGTPYDFQADESTGPYFLSFGQLLPMLTPYGYSLFVDKSTGPLQTLMRGTIDGKYAVSLSLQAGPADAPGTLGGIIVYDRIGEPINLSGMMNGNQVVLHELDASKNELSNIEVSWDGTKLTGSFTNLKSKKQMSFVAGVVGGK